MPASSAARSVNAGPGTQAPHTVPEQERTWNWYALPVVAPTTRLTRVLVAEGVASVTSVQGPSDLALLPLAIWTWNDEPVPDHFTSTGILLLLSGWRTVIGSTMAARLWTGAVAVGDVDTGV